MYSEIDYPVIVTGLPRSGTSFVAGVLHEALGVCMGEEFIFSPYVNNNRSFEDKRLVKANYQFTNNEITFQEYKWRLTACFNQMAKRGSWGFKEPRFAYGLLGFAIPLFNNFTLIHCVRKPEQVIASMQKVFAWKESRALSIYQAGMMHLEGALRFFPHKTIDLSEQLTDDDVKEQILNGRPRTYKLDGNWKAA